MTTRRWIVIALMGLAACAPRAPTRATATPPTSEIDPLVACASDDECALTYEGCCACGSPGLVALRRGHEEAYRVEACGTEPLACPECVGGGVMGEVSCVSGRCEVLREGEAGASEQARGDGAARSCEVPSDCVVVPRTCCGRCGAAAPGDAVARSARWLEQQREAGAATCEGEESCVDCFATTPATLIATCLARRCALVDLTRTPITACRSDEECVLEHAGCCECGSPGPIALRRGREGAYRRTLCGAGPVSCLGCIGPPLVGTAACVEGHCAVRPPTSG